jgi:hypothetical protein
MNYQQAVKVLETITLVYPHFVINETKAKFLIPWLEKMDFDGVMKNLSRHIYSNGNPPTIEEIAAYPKGKNDSFQEMEAWQKEAAKVSYEEKLRFQQEIESLIRKKMGE